MLQEFLKISKITMAFFLERVDYKKDYFYFIPSDSKIFTLKNIQRQISFKTMLKVF